MSNINTNTLLGTLELISEETSNITFLQGQFHDMPFSIQVSTPIDFEKINFDFILDKLNNFIMLKDKAEKFLKNILITSPNSLGISSSEKINGELVSFPEFIFGENNNWSIVFRDSPLPIAEPYGILINYQNDNVIGFEDLSDAEEL
ncbi:hypothetical protein [Neisseria dentiae]|uniref:hypothetical protein n=1 Tax=Neisseria dentiae TaxID=194197 RepID=UPI00359FAF9A